MYVCICKGIREEDVRRLGERGVTSEQEIEAELGLDSPQCCGRCRRNMDRFVALARPLPRGTLEPLPLVSYAAAQG